MWTALGGTCVTSSMFSTALSSNLLALALIKKTADLEITWTQWFLASLPVGVVLLILFPILVYKIYPPEIKNSKGVPPWAAQELQKMGKVKPQEIGMAATVILALVLWIFGRNFVDATMVAVVLVSVMVIIGIIQWEDVLANQSAWNVLVWFATLVTLAEGLNKVGFATWFAEFSASFLGGLPPIPVMVILVAIFFGVHYMFASITAHVAAILPVILLAGSAIPGVPTKTFAMLYAFPWA